jgi:hypothetical protein
MQSEADTSAAPADAAEKSATKASRQDTMCIESLPSSAPHIMYPLETEHETYTILGIARVIVTHAYGKFSLNLNFRSKEIFWQQHQVH